MTTWRSYRVENSPRLYITGTVDQELLLRNQITGRVRLTDGEHSTLAAIGTRLGEKGAGRSDVGGQTRDATGLVPETYRKEVRWISAPAVSGTATLPSRDRGLSRAICQRESHMGARSYRGCTKERRLNGERPDGRQYLEAPRPPSGPERKETTMWREFIRSHRDLLVGTDFFTAAIWTRSELVTYYILFFIQVGSRTVHIAELTPNPNGAWMTQMARNSTMSEWGFLTHGRHLLHDRDTKFCSTFQETMKAAGVTPLKLPARSPNLNAHAEHWVRSVKEEALSKLILLGKAPSGKCSTSMAPIIIRNATIRGKGTGSWCHWPVKGAQRVP